MNNRINNFREFAANYVENLPHNLVIGQIVRFGKDNKLAYKLREDGSGWVQDWTRHSKPIDFIPEREYKTYTPEEKRAFAIERQREAEAAARQKALENSNAAQRAADLYNNAAQADSTPYTLKKGIQTHNARLAGDLTVIPFINGEGYLTTVETIDAKSNKRFLKGGVKKGSYCPIGTPTDIILISEGFATAATLHEQSGFFSIAAGDAGNLKSVGLVIRNKYPAAKIVFCADKDLTQVGEKSAIDAANLVGGVVILPPHDDEKIDFNDYYVTKAGAIPVANLIAARSIMNWQPREYLEPKAAGKKVEGLVFDWFKSPRQMAIQAAAGSGKTTAVINAINNGMAEGKEVHFYVPTIEHANELAAKINDCVVIEGRKEKNCQRHEVAATLGKLGIPVYAALCSTKVTDNDGVVSVVNCPFMAQCEYVNQFSKSNVKIMTHAFLSQNHSALEQKADLVIIDERFFSEAIGTTAPALIKDLFELDKLGAIKNPLMDALDKLACGECTNLLNVFSESAKATLLDDVTKTLKALDNQHGNTMSITPAMSDATILLRATHYKNYSREISILKTLQFEIEQFEKNPNQPSRLIKAFTNSEGAKLFQINYFKTNNRLNYWKRKTTPVLCIDADADELILNNFFTGHFNKGIEFHSIDIKRNAYVTQVVGSQYGKSRFTYNDDDGKNLAYLVKNLTKTAGNRKALVVTYQALETKLDGLLPDNFAVAHFNAIRGLDKYKDFDMVFIVGRNQPPITEMENTAAALFWESNKQIEYGKALLKVENNYYSQDERVNSVLAQFRECEVLQAIDRLRLVHNIEQKEVVIVTNLPLNIEVHRTVQQFKDITESIERKLSHIVESCDGLFINSATFLFQKFGHLFKNFEQVKNQISKGKSPYKDFYMGNYPLKIFRFADRAGGKPIMIYDTKGRTDAALIEALELVTGRAVQLVQPKDEIVQQQIIEIVDDAVFVDDRIFAETSDTVNFVNLHFEQTAFHARE